ncbi:hypothetical protein PA39016_003090005 [Pseudomonas aeruginosa 39016]|nr:hypothetical protein PA39016_003090005 [Pseudomonas aeruginosa 39016]
MGFYFVFRGLVGVNLCVSGSISQKKYSPMVCLWFLRSDNRHTSYIYSRGR